LACSSPSSEKDKVLREAEKGNAAAQYKLGEMYGNGQGIPKDDAEAARWIKKAADQGYVEAQYILGGMYGVGKCVPQDDAEAVKWLRKAADQGHAGAQYILGGMYGMGKGVPQDYIDAVKWTQKAADQGYAEAQDTLGFIYATGRFGVQKDYVQSYYWYSLATSRSSGEDHKKYSDARDKAAENLTPEKLMDAQRMTREWEKSHPRN
jgi:uncharacterized protein